MLGNSFLSLSGYLSAFEAGAQWTDSERNKGLFPVLYLFIEYLWGGSVCVCMHENPMCLEGFLFLLGLQIQGS